MNFIAFTDSKDISPLYLFSTLTISSCALSCSFGFLHSSYMQKEIVVDADSYPPNKIYYFSDV